MLYERPVGMSHVRQVFYWLFTDMRWVTLHAVAERHSCKASTESVAVVGNNGPRVQKISLPQSIWAMATLSQKAVHQQSMNRKRCSWACAWDVVLSARVLRNHWFLPRSCGRIAFFAWSAERFASCPQCTVEDFTFYACLIKHCFLRMPFGSRAFCACSEENSAFWACPADATLSTHILRKHCFLRMSCESIAFFCARPVKAWLSAHIRRKHALSGWMPAVAEPVITALIF
jgi:hypothetical protein